MNNCRYDLYLGTQYVGYMSSASDAYAFYVTNPGSAVYRVYSDGSSVRLWGK